MAQATEAVLEDLTGTVTARARRRLAPGERHRRRGEHRGAAETQVTIAGFRGAAALILRGGATAAVKDFAGQLKAEVAEGRLTIDQVARLELHGATRGGDGDRRRRAGAGGGDRRAPGASTWPPFRATCGWCCAARPRRGSGSQLPASCAPSAPPAFDGSQLEVTGCDQNAPGQGARTAALRRTYGGQAMVLTANLDATARLEVEGE